MEAAKLRQQQETARRRRNQFLRVGLVLGVLVLVSAIGYVVLRELRTDVDAPAIGESDHELVVGSADAPHEVIVYEDFLCPYCGALEGELDERLSALAEDGEVRVAYRPIELLGDYSARSAGALAVVLEESGPTVAKRFHDLLYENQPSESGDHPDDAWLVDLAVEAGAKEDAVRAAIEGEEKSEWVEAATEEAEEAGVSATPTLLLDGEVFEEDLAPAERADALIEELG